LLRTSFVKRLVQKKIDKAPAGLDDVKREKSTSLVWGQVSTDSGEAREARLAGPDAYTMTAISTLLIAGKALEGNFKAGYQTPAAAYGENLVMEIPGVTRELIP